jgi:hypothetical protein
MPKSKSEQADIDYQLLQGPNLASAIDFVLALAERRRRAWEAGKVKQALAAAGCHIRRVNGKLLVGPKEKLTGVLLAELRLYREEIGRMENLTKNQNGVCAQG